MSDLTVEQQRDLLAQALLLFDVLVDCKLAEWASDSAIRLVDCDE